jgi:hypothetical protein
MNYLYEDSGGSKKMKITKGKLKKIIEEEIQTFVDSLRKDILQEGKISPDDLKNLLEQLEQQDGNR